MKLMTNHLIASMIEHKRTEQYNANPCVSFLVKETCSRMPIENRHFTTSHSPVYSPIAPSFLSCQQSQHQRFSIHRTSIPDHTFIINQNLNIEYKSILMISRYTRANIQSIEEFVALATYADGQYMILIYTTYPIGLTHGVVFSRSICIE